MDPTTLQASDFTVNGIAANSVVYTPGTTTMTFHFNSTPVTTQGEQMMHIPAGAFNDLNGDGNLDFTCSFCYAATPLQVTTTNPPDGGTFEPPAPGDYQYDVNFNQAVDPASVTTGDLTLTGNAGGSVTSVSLVNGNTTARFMLHFSFGGSVTASIGAGAITANGCNGNAAFSGTYTVDGCPPQDHYDIEQIGGSIVPGTVDTGNHIDDGTTTIALPFSYTLYDQTYTSVSVDSNGTLQFGSPSSVFTNACLPDTSRTDIVFPYWDDLRTDANTGCSTYPGGACGIFTSITGSAPNRIFNIEYRAVYFAASTSQANFEVRLYEGQSRFDVIYGTVALGNSSATAGVEKDTSAFDQVLLQRHRWCVYRRAKLHSAVLHADTDADPDGDTNTDRDAHGDTNTDRDAHGNTNTDSNTHGDADPDTGSDCAYGAIAPDEFGADGASELDWGDHGPGGHLPQRSAAGAGSEQRELYRHAHDLRDLHLQGVQQEHDELFERSDEEVRRRRPVGNQKQATAIKAASRKRRRLCFAAGAVQRLRLPVSAGSYYRELFLNKRQGREQSLFRASPGLLFPWPASADFTTPL